MRHPPGGGDVCRQNPAVERFEIGRGSRRALKRGLDALEVGVGGGLRAFGGDGPALVGGHSLRQRPHDNGQHHDVDREDERERQERGAMLADDPAQRHGSGGVSRGHQRVPPRLAGTSALWLPGTGGVVGAAGAPVGV